MSEDGDDVFSGKVGTQPQMVNVQPAGTMMYVERSSAPQVIGILVIIYGVLMTLGALSSVFGLFEPADEGGIPAWLLIGQMLTGLILSVATAYAGFLIYSYKKQGIWISLGAIAAGWVINSIWTYLSTDYMLASTPEASEFSGMSEIIGGASAICSLFCAGICGIIVAMPLFLSNHGME
ncbi:MAG: hypothetical protein P8Q96_06740 [Candidatus Thalassarchaeaceae archaeon]|nr:hypothetical protein [Candidatus Thalassarchaeaceae archaeon]